MRVTLTYGETKVGGMIFRLNTAVVIKLVVEFSELERAVIKKHKLEDYVWYNPPLCEAINNPRIQGPSLVSYLLRSTPEKPSHLHFDDLARARIEEVKIRDSLKQLKDTIDSLATPIEQSSTFEL